MNLKLLTCPNCGAPTPPPEESAASIVCAYCKETATVELSAAELPPGASLPIRELSWVATKREFQDRLDAFTAEFKARISSGMAPYPALRESAAQELDVFGKSEALANVVFALATDQDAALGTSCHSDPEALAKLALGYFDAVQHLRDKTVTEHEVMLPFLGVSESGPVHFERTFTAQLIAELAARPGAATVLPSPAPSPAETEAAPEPAPEPEKKPFWKRLFS